MKKNHAYRMLLIVAFYALALSMTSVVFAEEDVQDNAQQENGIPVMTVTIDETAEGYSTIEEMQASKDCECTGTVDIYVPEGFQADYTDVVQESVEGLKLDYIRGRGNTTWQMVKKPYKLKFKKKSTQDLFGMGANAHWVLLANHKDPTKIKNRITFWLGRQLGLDFTPHGVPVDLYMKSKEGTGTYDEYLGSYYLCEHIRVDENRVDIGNLDETMTDESVITGGYLFSIGSKGEPTYKTKHCRPGFFYQSPEPDELNPEQKAYIEGFLQNLEDTIFTEPFDENVHAAVAAQMDLKSTADYWLIQMFSGNLDAFWTASSYAYKKRDDKYYWGPLWDYDQAWYADRKDKYSQLPIEWIDHLRSCDPQFDQLLEERWGELDAALAELTRTDGVIDQYSREVERSWEADYEVYKDDLGPLNYGERIKKLKEYIETRRAYISDHLEQYVKGQCTATFIADEEVVASFESPFGVSVQNPPAAPAKEGYYFTGWYSEQGDVAVDELLLGEDTTFIAKYEKCIKLGKLKLKKSSFTYTGKGIKAAVLSIGGKSLAAGTDYTVKYSASSPKNVGKYTVTVTGKGKYIGASKASYKINPKGTAIKSIKRNKRSLKVKWKKRGAKMSAKRITGYQVQIARDKNFTKSVRKLTVKGYKKTSKKIGKLESKKTYYVRVRTYMKKGGTAYCSPWSKVKKVRTK